MIVPVRVIDRDGGAWFVANDVCVALEIGNSRQAVSRLEDDERDDQGVFNACGSPTTMGEVLDAARSVAGQ